MHELLIVEDVFAIARIGLVLAPDVPYPAHGFAPFSDTVKIVAPDGASRESEARFSLTQFRPGGYKLFVTLPHGSREEVEVGSHVLVSVATWARLQPPET